MKIIATLNKTYSFDLDNDPDLLEALREEMGRLLGAEEDNEIDAAMKDPKQVQEAFDSLLEEDLEAALGDLDIDETDFQTSVVS